MRRKFSAAAVLFSFLLGAMITNLGCNSQDKKDFFDAINFGQEEKVKEIVKSNPDSVNWKKDGFTGLYLACLIGQPKIVKILLDEKADANILFRDQVYSVSPLCAAVISPDSDKVKVVEQLIKAGANVNFTAEGGLTPLYFLICLSKPGSDPNSRVLIVRMLAKAGAKLNVRAWNGKTALHFAIERGDKDVIAELVSLGADLEARDNSGMTPNDLMEKKRKEAYQK